MMNAPSIKMDMIKTDSIIANRIQIPDIASRNKHCESSTNMIQKRKELQLSNDVPLSRGSDLTIYL